MGTGRRIKRCEATFTPRHLGLFPILECNSEQVGTTSSAFSVRFDVTQAPGKRPSRHMHAPSRHRTGRARRRIPLADAGIGSTAGCGAGSFPNCPAGAGSDRTADGCRTQFAPELACRAAEIGAVPDTDSGHPKRAMVPFTGNRAGRITYGEPFMSRAFFRHRL